MFPTHEDYDRNEVTQEEVDAFYADMSSMPIGLPTPEEVEEMAKAMGAEKVPF